MNLKQELAQFTGTEQYYRDYMGILVTDGIKAMMGLAKCGWLVSDIAVIVTANKQEPFIVIKIDSNGKHAIVSYSDGNDKKIYEQEYRYTDFPEAEVKMYFTDNVLMLASEY